GVNRNSLLFIFALIIYVTSLIKLEGLLSLNSTQLDEKISEINRVDSSLKEIRISKQTYDDTKPYFQSAREFLGSLTVSVGRSIPMLKETFVIMNLIVKFESKVDNFESALSYYKVLEDEKYFTGIKSFVPAQAQITDDERVWEESIIEKIIDKLNNQNAPVSKNIISLLYKEHNGFDTTNVYREIIRSDLELINLAKILIDSNQLVKAPKGIVYRSEDIVAIFEKGENFNLQEINNQLSYSLRILDYLNSYVEFLEKNEVYSGDKPNIEFIVNEIDNEHLSFEEQVVELTYKVGKTVFSKEPILDNNLVEAFSRASVSIKFHDEITLRNYACKYSANDYATAVIRAYYEKADEGDRKEAVSIKELIYDLELINEKYNKKEDEKDFKFLKSQLKEGTWYDSTPALLKDYIKKEATDIKNQISNRENYDILKNAVRKTFQDVKIGTVEKAIDAQVFGAYVIMSSSSEGHLLTELVDKLSIRDLDANGENRWRFKLSKQSELISGKYSGVEPKYDFINFSVSTRIGVLKKGQSFLDFQKDFFSDLKTILDVENKHFQIGLVIQRITPSKYSFGMLDDDDTLENLSLKNLDVAWYIARLASDHVPLEEQASVMKFEKNIDLLKIIDELSICELAIPPHEISNIKRISINLNI
ncbi:MAG: hypothetical protein KAT05_14820, partial [Spirochaetes bacterium]|nr:hypothetical protein [Spirochaetota bacterium]